MPHIHLPPPPPSFNLPSDQNSPHTQEKGTMKMANKLVSVFLMCIVVMAALHIPQAAADKYKTCYESCNQDCRGEGNGQTFCEMKCDSDCVEKVAAEKLDAFKP